LRDRALEVDEHAPSLWQQGMASVGNGHEAARTVEERRANVLLESPDLVAQGWLAESQLVCRAAEVQALGDR
jgi:hypothetical protein